MVSERLKELLEKQQYGFSGEHSAVKICTWTKKSIRDEGVCYKEQFYGIKSHRCCQMTPTLGYCQNRCIFCWRSLEDTEGTQMSEPLDDPKTIVDNSIAQQRKLLSGFGGNDKVNPEKLAAAQDPLHFAISLSGEPTLYPKLNELIDEVHVRGMTTFVVSNGLSPDVLRTLHPPTQLYLSVDAPNKDLYTRIDNSVLPDSWERFQESLAILATMKDATRTTLRCTLIKGMNMTDAAGWGGLIKRADPLFVEVKAYMFVGSSRLRLTIENMPRHHEVRAFAEEIANESGYQIIDEKEESRVVLLMKEDTESRLFRPQ
ncbi:MAG: 4-demethylwyosine synthase TYW1 [Nanobdellota archaeon]